jgi:hypothetical protein
VSHAALGLNVWVRYGIERRLICVSSVFSPMITKTLLNDGTLARVAWTCAGDNESAAIRSAAKAIKVWRNDDARSIGLPPIARLTRR